MITQSRYWRLAPVIISVGLILWALWAWWSDRAYRAAILAAELQMANGRFGFAARELTKLLDQSADTGEAALLLGRCEQERGRLDAAAKALARVPPQSILSHKAVLARMRIFHDQGQLAAAERFIMETALDPRYDSAHLRVLLVPIYSQLGRLSEAQQLLEDWWNQLNDRGEGASEPALDQLRMHIELDLSPNAAEDIRAYLDQAYQLDPNDDRVWLGQANLAIRTSAYDDARRWLDRCLQSRPLDLPVWSAFLRLGLATNQLDLVRKAMDNLPSVAFTTAQTHELEAWRHAQEADRSSEQTALEKLIAISPADFKALNRLIQLAETAGHATRVQTLKDKKAGAEKRVNRYHKLFRRNQPLRDAEEMASLADQLGRPFEARAFLTLEIAQDPTRADLRQQLARLTSEPPPASAQQAQN